MAETDTKNAEAGTDAPKESVLETWLSLGAFVATVLALRFLIFEPFKIPSGSMEPTLIGHPDYGDRIVTNLLAYQSLANCLWKLGLTLVFVLCVVLLARSLRKRGRAWTLAATLAVAVAAFAGIFLALQEKAIAGEPERFDIVVFRYEEQWSDDRRGGAKNYIKRLIGLPGETIVISGGDLFLKDKATGKEEIIRKWQAGDDLQDSLWQPVSLSSFTVKDIPDDADASRRQRLEAENHRAFPWTVEKPETTTLARKTGELDIEGEATLTYAHQVTNAYIKMGRWPFQHLGCPKAHLPPVVDEQSGMKGRDSEETSEKIRPYLPNSWSGVACPNCGELRFPLSRDRETDPRIVPSSGASGVKVRLLNAHKSGDDGTAWDLDVEVVSGCLLQDDNVHADQPTLFRIERLTLVGNDGEHDVEELDAGQAGQVHVLANGEFKPGHTYDWLARQESDEATPYFYGGYDTVGDLKLEIEFLSRADAGAIELVAGSDRHRAGWIVSLGDKPAPPIEEGRHEFVPDVAKSIEKGTRHRLSLAYVDGTLIGKLDGEILGRQELEVEPLGPAAIRSFARVRFLGAAKVQVYRLDLFRDLYHTLLLDAERSQSSPNEGQTHHRALRLPQDYAERVRTGRFELTVPTKSKMMPEGRENQDHYLMMGDNSPSSRDSRCWGFVPRDHLVGRASFVWWPPSRCRIMR